MKEDDIKNEDDLKIEDILKNENDLKHEDNHILKTVSSQSLHNLSCGCFFH